MPTVYEDVNKDGCIDLQDRLLADGWVDRSVTAEDIKIHDNAILNRMILYTWPFFSLFLLTQPWLSNYTNNMWFNYSSDYAVYARNGSLAGDYYRPGICDTDAKFMHCTDGQNFTELALKYRGRAKGCGCGQGILGEGLCPMTSYGYTLSDFVSTEPAIAAMLGLGFFPLLGTWRNTMIVNQLAKPGKLVESIHMYSMVVFQFSYVLWGIASDCIFPTSHAVLTVAFLGAFLVHWVITAFICIAHWGVNSLESVVTLYVAVTSVMVISLGAIPRVFLTLNTVIGSPIFPNLNYGLGSYAFWAAEACGLSLTFGAYPLILIGFCIPRYAAQKPPQFQLWANKPQGL